MQNILKYFCFSLLILILGMNQSNGQQKRVKGPWLGFELGNWAYKYFDPGFTGYTVSLDYEKDLRYYPVMELGMLNIQKDQEKMDYSTEGYFGKIGVNYNFLDSKGVWDYNILFAGLRLGFANYQHKAENIVIENNYFGNYQIGDISNQNLKALWTEAVVGLRVEVINNVFLGWSLRGKLRLISDKDKQLTPYFIPGYGSGEDNSTIRIQYYISYKLPIIKSDYKDF